MNEPLATVTLTLKKNNIKAGSLLNAIAQITNGGTVIHQNQVVFFTTEISLQVHASGIIGRRKQRLLGATAGWCHPACPVKGE